MNEYPPLPGGIDEDQLVQVLHSVVNHLYRKFQFGIYDRDDIYQQAYIWAKKAMLQYEPGRGRSLFSFLYANTYKKLINLRRDKLERITPPCLECPLNAYLEGKCTLYSEHSLDECRHYSRWLLRNSAKRSIAQPTELDVSLCVTPSAQPVEVLVRKEELELILSSCSIEDRDTLLRFLQGTRISQRNLDAIFERVRTALFPPSPGSVSEGEQHGH